MNTKFTDLIPETYSCHIEKLFDGLHSNSPLAKTNCSKLIKITKLIREESLIEHNDFSNLSGLEDTLRQTDYILSKINTWISGDELYENQDAEIFLGSLRNKFKELIVAMKYLDEN